MDKQRNILVAIDESRPSTKAFEWAMTHVVRGHDKVHILTVMPPINYAVYPVAPVATAAAVNAVTHQWDGQKRHNESAASETLQHAAQSAQVHYGVNRDRLELHALPGAGGASGVAETVVEYAKAKGVDMVVVGSRGLGSVKRSLLSFVGLGSVSDYVVHNSACPVVVVRYNEQQDHIDHATHTPGPRKILVACDDSQHSEASLLWVLEHLLIRGDDLHIVSAALPVPFPLMDEAGVAAVALESQMWRERQEESAAFAERITAKARELAVTHGVQEERITCSALKPNGGASDVGAAICKYAEASAVDVVALGSRGMGSIKRSLMSFIGLGSVSDYTVHHVHCAVAIIKAPHRDADADADAVAPGSPAPAH